MTNDHEIVSACDDRQWNVKDGQDDEKFGDQVESQPVEYMENASVTLGPGQCLRGTGWKVTQIAKICRRRYFEPPAWMLDRLEHVTKDTDMGQACLESGCTELRNLHLPRVTLHDQDVRRWQWAWGAPLHWGERSWRERSKHWPAGDRQFYLPRLLFPESNIWPKLHEFERPSLAISFSFASASYGALHALAWSAASPTKAEKYLWRMSVCTLTCGLPLFLFSYCLLSPGRRRHRLQTRLLGAGTWKCLRYLMDHKRPVRLMLFIYFLARIYLVVECFVNLFHLPAAVFQTPNWSVYCPHIS